MTNPSELHGLQLQSLVKPEGTLEISLVSVAIPRPGPDEVVVRVDAAPINPSDMGLLFGSADLTTLVIAGTPDRPIVTARIAERAMTSMAGRLGTAMPVGNEGAGLVVDAGTSNSARALVGKMVAALGGAMYAQYRCVSVDQCMVLPDGATAAQGASSFVNPLTSLGMVETMQREGHKALVHTAAASNLGQMLDRLCQRDGIGLVNIVRSPDQVAQLRGQGAAYVCDTTAASFTHDLTEALVATGATLAFDATGGGTLASKILNAMEVALNRTAKAYSRYGSPTHKQVYLYGGLDTRPTELVRNFGMAWGIGGWLVFPFLQRTDPARVQVLKQRVAAELTTTFATRYTDELSLAEALQSDAIAAYGKRATGPKYLINPNKGLR